jgi:dTDP-glucose 4,6-dehydratase
MKVLLTGGCGFIGSAVVRHLLRRTDHVIVNVDKMTYAASEEALEEARNHNRHVLIRADVADAAAMHQVFATHQPDAVMHLAAESHVDRSIDGPAAFVQTNVVGTFTLLEAARTHYATLDPVRRSAFRFHHISTDEVFGALGPGDPPFCETTPYDPRSPYAASKAASDHLVRAWQHTYGLPVIVSNTCNNYGPWQFPEKLIPLVTLNALEGKELPVYGDGSNCRDWLFVEDHAEALVRVVQYGQPGATYAIGARQPRSNLEVVRAICAILDRRVPDPAGPRSRLIRFVTDRPGHDFRYEIDPARTEIALGWRAPHDFDAGLERTIDWYLGNRAWWEAVRGGRYAGQRLGVQPLEAAPEAASLEPSPLKSSPWGSSPRASNPLAPSPLEPVR